MISNNCGVDNVGSEILLQTHQLRKMVSSYIGKNKEFESQFLHGELEVQLVPQGTLTERIRAGGAGLSAFYTPTRVGTTVSEGDWPVLYDKEAKVIKASEPKDVRVFDGKMYVLERGITAEFALIKAWKGDKMGNLVYRNTTANVNPTMAMADKITIADIEELVEVGDLDPNRIHTPGVYVQRIVQDEKFERRIERRTLKKA